MSAIHYAAMFFGATLFAALMGFGGLLVTAPGLVKAISVVFLLLFFLSLYRALYREEPGIRS